MTQDLMTTSIFGQFYNPAYESLKLIYWMKDAQAELAAEKKASHSLSVRALLSGCLAIEGYVNSVGQRVDPKWTVRNKDLAPMKERLTHIFQKLDRPIDLNRGIWKDVLNLFNLRAAIMHSGHLYWSNMHDDEAPEIIKEISEKYPILSIQAIAEEAIERLLNLSDPTHL